MSISNEGQVYWFGSFDKSTIKEKQEKLHVPKLLPFGTNVIAIAAGSNHFVFLDSNANVYSFGSNQYGQLGIDNENEHKVNLPPIKQVCCGRLFTVCLSEEGEVFVFGDNSFGKLGVGNTDPDYLLFPQKVESLENIEFIECGSDFTVCKSTDDFVYVFGLNQSGELGIGNFESLSFPYICPNWPKNIVDIKCGSAHTLVLTSDEKVFSCGNNYYSQLGRNVIDEDSENPECTQMVQVYSLSKIIRIECGESHSFCIDINNVLYVFGCNELGQLGLSDDINKSIPTKFPILNIIDVSKGGDHSFIKTSNNEIYAFGMNNSSQLGIETEHKYQLSPIRVFEDNEDIWYSNINKSNAKSARF